MEISRKGDGVWGCIRSRVYFICDVVEYGGWFILCLEINIKGDGISVEIVGEEGCGCVGGGGGGWVCGWGSICSWLCGGFIWGY